MNQNLIFQTGFELMCELNGLNSVSIYSAYHDVFEAGLEVNKFSKFTKNLMCYEGILPPELEIDKVSWLYLSAKIIMQIDYYYATPLYEDLKQILELEEGEQEVFGFTNDLSHYWDLLKTEEVKEEILDKIGSMKFQQRSNLAHWFYYKLTQSKKDL